MEYKGQRFNTKGSCLNVIDREINPNSDLKHPLQQAFDFFKSATNRERRRAISVNPNYNYNKWITPLLLQEGEVVSYNAELFINDYEMKISVVIDKHERDGGFPSVFVKNMYYSD